jgi:hypothetical protein
MTYTPDETPEARPTGRQTSTSCKEPVGGRSIRSSGRFLPVPFAGTACDTISHHICSGGGFDRRGIGTATNLPATPRCRILAHCPTRVVQKRRH